jgi:1,4-alpha-glucan branching enzyme
MKHNKNHDNLRSDGPQLQPVYFEFTHPTARTVCIAGTFNDWQPEAKPMHPMGDGYWVKQTELAPGTHEYCLVVDGQWMPDPLAKECVPNPFGGQNSVLNVVTSTEEGHRHDASHLPLINTHK